MIRGRESVVTAVRRPTGEIAVEDRPLSTFYTGRMRRTPFLRGIIVLLESMILGVKSLLLSAGIAMEEEEENISGKAIFMMLASAAVLVVVLFFIAPLFLTNLVNDWIPNSFLFHIVEGIIRLAIFIIYLKVVGMMPDIKRVFSYHGAEHKTVNAYEAGMPMEVESIKKYGTAHVRCGTSFLFLVLIIAIIVFSLVGRPNLWIMLASRVVLIPVIGALGYEVLYIAARHTDNWLVKIIQAPGLLLQSMTTAEPDDSQIEVAIAAMTKAIEIDNAGEDAEPSPA